MIWYTLYDEYMTSPEKKRKELKLMKIILKLGVFFLCACGFFFTVMVVLAMTTVPARCYYAMANYGEKPAEDIDFIVIMGGDGIPSGTGLIRSYYGAEAAKKYPKAKIVIACPGNTDNPQSTPSAMRDELVLRHVKRERILFENKGKNTWTQAVATLQLLGEETTGKNMLVISAPEHIPRCILSFRKVGYRHVYGLPTISYGLEADLRFDEPIIGESLTVRYLFWYRLRVQIKLIREFTALAYYRCRGWI